MDQRVAIPAPRLAIRRRFHLKRHLMRAQVWALSIVTVVLASAAVILVVWNPRAMLLALVVGLLAIGSRFLFARMRRVTGARVHTSTAETAASTTVATSGLVLALIVVAPLLAFVLLWAGLLALLGLMWFLHVVGLA